MFKVGQKVWCLMNGEGQVYEVDNKVTYKVRVLFNGSRKDAYTEKGELISGSNSRCLFFSPPIISAATEPPFVPTLVGKKVAIQDKRDGHIIIREIFEETADKIITDTFGNYWRKKDIDVFEITQVTFEE